MSELDLGTPLAPPAVLTKPATDLVLAPPAAVPVIQQEQAAGMLPVPAQTQSELQRKAEAFAADLRARLSVDLAVDPMSLFDNVFATPTPQLLEQRAMVQAELDAEQACR